MSTDARQVFDLPEGLITNSFKVFDLCHGGSQTGKKGGGCFRQVIDLLRIRAAKP